MRLEKAYSLDLRKNITAEEADSSFSRGAINSKFSFECPDEQCNAQVTCANLDRLKDDRKRDPYFKVVGEHHSDCSILKDIKLKSKKKNSVDDIYAESDCYVDGAFRLNLQPESTKRSVTEKADDDSVDDDSLCHLVSESEENGGRSIQRSKKLSSMVASFLAGQKNQYDVPPKELIPHTDLFIKKKRQKINELADGFRVYHGKAWINKRNDDGYYLVRFAEHFKYNEQKIRPSFFIPKKMIENASYKKFKQSTLESLANEKKPRDIFILTETSPDYSTSGYINFWLDSLEYMDYR